MTQRALRPQLIWAGIAAIVVGVIAGAVIAPAILNSPSAGASKPDHTVPASQTPTPTPTPLTPAQELLKAQGGPDSCAVTFAGTPEAIAPVLAVQNHRLTNLPVPTSPGQAFAGWYPDAASAAAMVPATRINDSRVANCNAQHELNLTAAWVSAEVAEQSKTEVPILMYHQFTEKEAGEDNWLKGNYVYVPTFAAHMQYIKDQGYYLPSWTELAGFVNGTVVLPERSLIITDDDADPTWIQWAAPIVAEKQLLTTSFVITSARQDPTPNEWVIQRSHTHDMHSAGANGKGKMVNYTIDEMVADLNASTQILGAKEALAYPFGHYNDAAKQAVAQAGFLAAVTTEPGFASRGDDPFALPRVRVNFGMSVEDLAAALGN